MNGIKWQKWIGQYNESLGQFGKTHATDNNTNTVCGVMIPNPSESNIEGESLFSVDCKRCQSKVAQYEKECREFNRGSN